MSYKTTEDGLLIIPKAELDLSSANIEGRAKNSKITNDALQWIKDYGIGTREKMVFIESMMEDGIAPSRRLIEELNIGNTAQATFVARMFSLYKGKRYVFAHGTGLRLSKIQTYASKEREYHQGAEQLAEFTIGLHYKGEPSKYITEQDVVNALYNRFVGLSSESGLDTVLEIAGKIKDDTMDEVVDSGKYLIGEWNKTQVAYIELMLDVKYNFEHKFRIELVDGRWMFRYLSDQHAKNYFALPQHRFLAIYKGIGLLLGRTHKDILNAYARIHDVADELITIDLLRNLITSGTYTGTQSLSNACKTYKTFQENGEDIPWQ